MAVQVVEFLVVHARRAAADALQVKPFDGLFGGDDLVIAVAPAEAEQVVAHRFRQIAHVAVGFDRQRAMALGKLCAIRPVDEGQVAIDRLWPAHRLDDLQLPRGIVQMVVPADDMRHAHVLIVHHHRQHIGRRAVGAQQDHVVEIFIGEGHVALDDVVHDGLAGLRRAQADDERFAVFLRSRRAIAPAAVVAYRLSGGALGLAHFVQFFCGGIAAIGFAFRQQLFRHLAMPPGARELINGLPIPVQTHPLQPVQDGGHGFRRGAFPVGILDAQEESPASVSGIEPVEQGGACAADMQKTGGRGREAEDGFLVFGHDEKAFGGRLAFSAVVTRGF